MLSKLISSNPQYTNEKSVIKINIIIEPDCNFYATYLFISIRNQKETKVNHLKIKLASEQLSELKPVHQCCSIAHRGQQG